MYSAPLRKLCFSALWIHYKGARNNSNQKINQDSQEHSRCCVSAVTLHPSHTNIGDNGCIFMVQTKYYRVQSAQCDTTNWFNYSANEVMTQCFARPELLFRSQPYLASTASALLQHNLKIRYLHLNMSMMMKCSGKDATEYCCCSVKNT